MKPKKPFMIERNDDCYRVFMSDANNGPRGKWVNWDGTKFQTKTEAEQIIVQHGLVDAKVIEILDEIRVRSGGH